jgi:hypothetical protein
MVNQSSKVQAVFDAALSDFDQVVVLLPDQDVDEVKISRAIRSLAVPEHADVTLMTLVNDPESELAAKRRLATISALVRDPWFKVSVQVVWSKSWVKSTRKVVKPGDLIVCPAELTIPVGLSGRKSLAVALSTALNLPVYVLKGYFTDRHFDWTPFLWKIPVWVLCLTILVGFFRLEVQIDLLTQGWPNYILMIIITLLEIGLISLAASIAL